MKKNFEIGFFDSGIGGLSVLSKCKRLLPNESFVYLSDEQNAPYGTKTDDEIIALCEKNVERLREINVKAIVVACNTATSVSIDKLRERYSDLLIVGVEPAINLAVKGLVAHEKNIVVLTTIATQKQSKFIKLVSEAKKQTKSQIIVLPQENLATIIEKNVGNCEVYRHEIERIFCGIYDSVGAVVLGCTHYIFLKRELYDYFGGRVLLYDGNQGTANRLKSLLEQNDLISDSHEKGKTKFIFC